jgi:hypothetical protein
MSRMTLPEVAQASGTITVRLIRRLRRRLRFASARLLAIALVVWLASGPTLATVSADQPAMDTVSGQSPTTPQVLVPQITDLGTIQETITPFSVQLQPTPMQLIPLASCTSPDYIFQGCPLGSRPGEIRADAERRLEDRAVTSVLQQYGLPDSARPLVLRYGRNEVRAALFAEIEEALQTKAAERSPDQQLLADVFTRLVREKHVQAMRAAQNEYQKWKLNPCSYQAPPGFSYTPPAGACIGISRAFTPESPGLKSFVAYGVARAYTGTAEASAAGYVPPSVSDPRASPVFWATSNAALLGYGSVGAVYAGGIGAAIVAGLPANVVASVFSFTLTKTGLQAVPIAVSPLQAGVPTNAVTSTGVALSNPAGAAAAVGGALAVVVAAISTAITAGESVFREAAIPGDLQGLVDTAGSYDVGYFLQTCVSGCVSAGSNDARQSADQELFANLVLTTLPDYPGNDPAPAAQPGDPGLVVGGSPVDWVQYTADDGSQRAFRLSSDSWFADRAGSDGAGTLTLSIGFKDASGGKWTARRVGNQFLIVRTDIPPTRFDYPAPRQSANLSVQDWSGNTVTATAGG